MTLLPELLAQGEVLEDELPVAAAEEREESEQASSVLIMRRQLSPDQSREINHLAGGWSFGEGQATTRARLPFKSVVAIRLGPALPFARTAPHRPQERRGFELHLDVHVAAKFVGILVEVFRLDILDFGLIAVVKSGR